jgi:hypothetical protein
MFDFEMDDLDLGSKRVPRQWVAVAPPPKQRQKGRWNTRGREVSPVPAKPPPEAAAKQNNVSQHPPKEARDAALVCLEPEVSQLQRFPGGARKGGGQGFGVVIV